MRSAPLLLSFLAVAVSVVSGQANARVGGPSQPPPSKEASPAATPSSLSAVTIEGQQSRTELRQQVGRFVTSVIVRSFDESLARWNTPICPVVEGLAPADNEILLTRVLQIAAAAHARLGGRHCRSNLYVIASDQPDQLLKKLWVHTPTMFNHLHGLGSVERYLHSQRPVRAWYNIDRTCRDGPDSSSPASAAFLGSSLESFTENSQGLSVCSGGRSPLSHAGVESISSAIIVADMSRTKSVTTEQLADYVTLIALAQIDLDADTGTTPTILGLFERPEHSSPRLTAWDRALLYSLYNTTQSNTMQLSTVEATVMRRLSGPSAIQ